MSVLTPPQTGSEPMVQKIITRIVRGWDGFTAIEPHWRRLFEKTRGCDPQSVWQLVQLEFERHRREFTPLIITSFVGGELSAIVPLLEPKRKLFKGKKNMKMLGYESTEFGISVIASEPRATWTAIELQLREYIAESRFEAIVLRRSATHLSAGAYVTDYASTKILRKVRPTGSALVLTEPIDQFLTPKASAWAQTFANAELKHSGFDELGDAVALLRRFVPALKPSFTAQLELLSEEGDAFVSWLEQDAQVVAAQAFIQTQDRIALLAGGGPALAQLQLKTLRTVHGQGVEVARFLSPTEDWQTQSAGLVEDVVIARV
jgi:hypothetical protein